MNTASETPFFWFGRHIEVPSRWLGLKDGMLVVWKVFWSNETGSRNTWRIINYELECEDTGEWKAVPYEVMQQQITKKRLINIGEYTKEAWIEMSKQQKFKRYDYNRFQNTERKT